MKRYWLMKSEPETFSIDDLISRPKQTEHWEGVRNYQARNFMRDDMQLNDEAFFYHSNCNVPSIVGIVTIVRTAYPDHFALDQKSDYYDPKSTTEQPRWYMVDVQFKQKFDAPIPLSELKANPKLKNLALVKPGNRLSIMPVSAQEWQIILQMHKTNKRGNTQYVAR